MIENYEPQVGDYICTKELDTKEKFDFAADKMRKVKTRFGQWKNKLAYLRVDYDSDVFNDFEYSKTARKLTLKDLGWVDKEVVAEETEEELTDEPIKVKSDGGKSSYYNIDTPQWFVDKVVSGELMVEDLTEVVFGNDFNYTNVFKAMKRVYEAEKGCGKEGNDINYDIKKMHYYTDKIQEKSNR